MLIPMDSTAKSHTGIPYTKMSIIVRPDLIAAREALGGRWRRGRESSPKAKRRP